VDPESRESLVRDGYDSIAERYTEWASRGLSPGRRHALDLIAALVPEGAIVLDLGCGAGLPMTAELARRYRVHGVDISVVQVELARRNVPTATFDVVNMATLELGRASLDAAVAFYSLTHLPRSGLPGLLGRVHEWLRPGGILVASLGTKDDPGSVADDWLGTTMYFSQFDTATNLTLIRDAGFDVVSSTIVGDPENAEFVEFLWVAARRRP